MDVSHRGEISGVNRSSETRKQGAAKRREEKRRGEGCNYTSLERGRLICSPLTLSLLFPDSDQRQTCMYLSRHAPLGTDGALQCPAWNYSAFSSAEVMLQSTLRRAHSQSQWSLPVSVQISARSYHSTKVCYWKRQTAAYSWQFYAK